MTADDRLAATRESYDRVADQYAELFLDELDDKPFDRAFLDRLAPELQAHTGPTVDLGSGPGQIGAYLATRGVRVVEADLSHAMLVHARTFRAGAEAVQLDMRAFPIATGGLGAIVAFYSLIHIAPPDLSATLTELRRTLEPGGHLVIAVHAGDELLHVGDWHGQPVDLDFTFFASQPLAAEVEAAGFTIEAVEEREHHVGSQEADTRRVYVVARR